MPGQRARARASASSMARSVDGTRRFRPASRILLPMLETLQRGFRPAYVIPVLAGLALALLFPSSKAIADPIARRKYRLLQLCTLFGALGGAKLAAIVG